MGLDQFANYRESYTGKDNNTEFAYWRKHNRLQGWMEKLWREKTGSQEMEFNCVEVELTIEDLDSLEQAINDKTLPETCGFFFGDDSYEDYEGEHGYKATDMEFIENARKEINRGNKVFYSSWW